MNTSEKKIFLLMSNVANDYWHQVLKSAVISLGCLRVCQEDDVVSCVLDQVYALIIIDATFVKDAPRLVKRIKMRQADAKIVVVTASPTWRQARKVLYAGAVDYIHKILDESETLQMLQATLKKKPPAYRYKREF